MREDRLRRMMSCMTILCLTVLGLGCAGLIPAELKYNVHMDSILPEGRGDYYVDPDDSSTVFSKEGLLVKVRHVNDDELNGRFPPLYDGRYVNPYSFEAKDREKGYVPPRFTVFEVELTNKTYSKVEFDPATATMVVGGETYRYYDPGREGAIILGGNSFNKYYRTELGTSGNEREIDLERMSIIYQSVHHRHRPIFKGDSRLGLLVFDPLPEGNHEIFLTFSEFVLSRDASGNVDNMIDIDFHFEVTQEVLDKVKVQDAEKVDLGEESSEPGAS